ncbi:glutaredoxin domain-containing protein [Methanotrichaceae archaeon M04Ac]|uniref:Glutaredoxin domain-containing protein n=1 Tax=Candidatus Methanocrinis alkalitolerans TaxID=3033395 RepID=A0ABT5XGS4_9EURY|nr:glutaredoxin domain-containing protein [Candidatus Methanocrinis alkalitolerans]MCR3883479.1 NrdH-redoxin [Methanothrix sp.]MDF0593867.1 glutaredoxin domain-containing protein [Candidatus Methanocrinis alkalitolerans]
MKYVVYTTAACPRCEEVKRVLKGWGIEFETVDMATPEAMTELRVNGVFTLSAPVLMAGDDFYTVEDLFDGEAIRDLEAMGLRS